MAQGSGKQLKAGAIIAYLTIAFSIASGIIYTPWMIDRIGQSDYGLYTLANSVISLFLVDFGLSSATSFFVAKYRAKNAEESVQSFLSAVYKLYLFIDAFILLAFLVVYLFSGRIYANLAPAELEKFRVIFCISAVYSLISFPCVTFNGVLTAYERFIPLKLSDLIQKVLVVVFTVIALLCGMKLYALVAVNAVCGLISIAYKYWYVRKSVSIRFVKNEKSLYKQIFGFSVWSTVWAIMQRLIFNITPTIIGITVKAATAAIAVFGVVTTIEGYFHIVTSALNGMFLSRITRITQQESDGKQLTALAVKIGRFQFGLNSLILLGFFFVGREFIHLWVGDSYADAYLCIMLVMIPGLFYNSLQIFNTAMIAQNLIKYQAYIQIVIGVCNVTLSLVFTYLWGVLGASLSICISYIVRVLLTLLLIHKKLNASLPEYIKKCYLRMSVPFAFTFGVCFAALNFVNADNWIMLVLKGAIVVAVYGVFCLIFGLNIDERQGLLRKLHLKK